jgi:hypothetical protein
MDQASRKSTYDVIVVGGKKLMNCQDKQVAQELYNEFKLQFPTETVLFCTNTPTVSKGQIEPDLY